MNQTAELGCAALHVWGKYILYLCGLISQSVISDPDYCAMPISLT